VLLVLGFLIGTYYKAKVEKRIQHDFDSKLEALKDDLRKKDQQISALRSGALSGLASRQAAIDKRRLEAIDRLWASAIAQNRYKALTKMTQSLKMEEFIQASTQQDADGEKARKMATFIWNSAHLDDVKQIDCQPENERPFLSPLVWALFSAYRQVLALPIVQLAAARTGAGDSVLADPKPLLNLVKSAIPHQTEFIDKYGRDSLAFLVDELEERLLSEIRSSLHNADGDHKSLEQAAAILKASDKLAESLRPDLTLPNA